MQKRIYRFVGSSCFLGNGQQLERYGQQVELNEAEAVDYIVHGHAALVPDEDFREAGHVDKELAVYATPQLQATAPAEFIAKRTAVWHALHAHREVLANISRTDGEPPAA